MRQAITEVAKDVKDDVGEMIEQGVQSVVGKQLTPQQIQQKQLQDQKELAEARRKIAWFKKLDEEQKGVREANKQKEIQRLQNQKQQVQGQKIQKAQMPQSPKRSGQMLREDIARSQAERGKGRGVGG